MYAVSAAFDGRADSRIPKTRRHVMCFFGLPHVGQALEPKQQISRNKNGQNIIIGQICVGRWSVSFLLFSMVGQMLGCSKRIELLYIYCYMLQGTASQPGARPKTANVRNNVQTEVLLMYYKSSNMTKSESNMLITLHLGIFAKKTYNTS